MRVVLYAHDMEPITILSLDQMAIEYLKQRALVVVPVYESPDYVVNSEPRVYAELKTVTISREQFRRKGVDHMMLFTHDEESALLLKSAFLPGQEATVRQREQTAFARGFVHAIQRLGT